MGTRRGDAELGVIREYERLAPKYDRRWSFYTKATHRETLKRAVLQSADCVLDVGCGTAALFETISEKIPRAKLIGTDLSLGMLEEAKKKRGGQAFFVAGRSDALPFRSESFDAILSCSSFHHWSKAEESLKEVFRVLKPEGRVVMSDWCHDYWTCRFLSFCLRWVGPLHVVKTYRQSEWEDLFRKTGFHNAEIVRYKINWFWGLMTATGRKYVGAVR
jgi:ubiquinone/menaquinone biosynthesis C-methylase UbiE